jgi:predicted metal-dependent TIM-barrel fold hydrolase
MTLYPITKCTPARAADLIEVYGPERVLVNTAGDWGHSDPLAVPEFIFEMRWRGHDEGLIRKVVYDNPLAFFSECSRFQHVESEAAASV